MSDTTQQTLDQVDTAIAAVDAASQDTENTDAMQAVLDNASNTLQAIKDTIILNDEANWIATLQANNDKLSKLNDQIDELCKQLDKVTSTVKKVSNAVSVVVGAVTAVISAGVL
jgi:ABC-type uncharacterized transport system fused permease/ATPase subunit